MSDEEEDIPDMPVVNIVPALNVEELPPASLEQLKRQAIALIYAIGRAEGVRYKLVAVTVEPPARKQEE